MGIGYNTNVQYKGKDYHIQTEDSGSGDSMVITLLYHSGAVLHSKKTSYIHLIGRPSFEEELNALMREQHKAVIKELINGKYEGAGRGQDKQGK